MGRQKTLYGKTDMPLENLKGNRLGSDVDKYIEGLTEYVMNCSTPMSVALQGDWGTGKTSFINAMICRIEEISSKVKPHIDTLYFNTWQYSQLKQSDDLYSSFIIRITSELQRKHPANSENGKELLKIIGRLAFDAAKQYAKIATGYDFKGLDEFLKQEQEKTERIAKLKKSFAEMIRESANGDRVIIFVDDLDRLNPEKAVELLEVMKLFMDVEMCVFVLAIDYEVVVKGVRAKYGNDMSDEKCRSFFDKIIQLPFRMPVENYRLEDLLKDSAGDRLGPHTRALAELIKNTIGPNPRSFKRLFNSFDLISIVNSKQMAAGGVDPTDNALLLASLVVQMANMPTYEYLLEETEQEDFHKVFEVEQREDAVFDADVLLALKAALERIRSGLGNKAGGIEDFYRQFAQKLTLSSITTVATQTITAQSRSAAATISRIEVFRQSYEVSNPTEAVKKTFELILSERRGEIADFQRAFPKMVTFDPSEETTIFKFKKKLDISGCEPPLYLGTKTNSGTKTIQVQKLCRFFRLEAGTVRWFDGGEEVFANE